jgi:UDP-N-acetylmuramyl pentapeptide phosphotransferase/UDP-N-acetylglucosamine-1-phosphate transferase
MVISLSVVLVLGLLVTVEHAWNPQVGVVLAAGVFVAAVGFLDDLASLPVGTRFAAHATAAVAVILVSQYAGSIDIPLVGQIRLGVWHILLIFVWLVGVTNAYNFMDGIDGIAGVQAVVTGVAWFAMGQTTRAAPWDSVGLMVAASSLVFLYYNWSPARVFMGDAGSAFLGFIFAALPVMAGIEDRRLMFAGMAVLTPFLFDTGFTLVRRLLNGEDILQAHRSHLYQRLVISGSSHSTVTLLYALLAVVCSLATTLWIANRIYSGEILLFVLLCSCLSQWLVVIWRENRLTRRAGGNYSSVR